jgi:hypothetical protein
MTKEMLETMIEMSEANLGGSGRKSRGTGTGASSVTARRGYDCRDGEGLMEAVVGRENMIAAYRRVVGNKGSPGVDGMSVGELKPYLDEHWGRIKSELLEGRYRPQPVRSVQIPKPGGRGTRMLGIPVVVERLIGQALHQVLEPIFDPGFSESSYGFRRGRRAHQAVWRAREYVREGYRWVVDIDLERLFDRVMKRNNRKNLSSPKSLILGEAVQTLRRGPGKEVLPVGRWQGTIEDSNGIFSMVSTAGTHFIQNGLFLLSGCLVVSGFDGCQILAFGRSTHRRNPPFSRGYINYEATTSFQARQGNSFCEAMRALEV